MRIGVYTRVSTDLQVQRGESLDEQADEARAYCKYKNIPIIKIYREEGKSGKNTDRPELQKLIRDCKKGEIDTVIVKKLDRLSRSILDFERLLRLFEDYKITLVSLKENFDTSSPMSRAAVRIILVFAQLEREQTSERTRDAMIYRAKRGIWNGGHIPLGYDLIPKKGLKINEEEVKVAKLIFEKYVELASYIKVAQYINNLGHRTKQYRTKKGKERGGRLFIDSNIARIIQNPVYIGRIPYKAEVFSGTHLPIISEELFNQAQDIRKENDKRNGSLKKDNKHNFLLEGLLSCGECNTQMTPRWSRSKTQKRYFYYACTKPIHNGKDSCSIRTMSAPAIEQLVLNRIRSLATDNEVFQEVMAGNDNASRQRIKELRDIEQGITSELSAIDKKVSAIAEAFGETIAKDKEHVMALELNRLDRERKILLQKQTEARIEANDLETKIISQDAAKQSLVAFTENYRELSPYDKKALMSNLIHSVIYSKDKITIRYYVLDNLDIFLKKEGVTGTMATGAGFATPFTWRPNI